MKKTYTLIAALLVAATTSTQAQGVPPLPQTASMWASSELEHRFGDNQTGGQLPVFYPQNVYSKPPSAASPDNPPYQQYDICSIGGDTGYVALGFYPSILNGPGTDFTVFENVLRVITGTDTAVYEEWMEVAASMDGLTWYTFPADTFTGVGFAGRNFTYGNASNFKDPKQSGGDAFDLSLVGLDSAKYIRVTDATHYQGQGMSADLDAIAASWQVGDDITGVHSKTQGHAQLSTIGNTVYYCLNMPCTQVSVLDLAGKQVVKQASNGTCGAVQVPTNGLYLIRFETEKGQFAQKAFVNAE